MNISLALPHPSSRNQASTLAVPIVVIPIYAVLSYGAFKVFWPHIVRGAGPTSQQKNDLNEHK